MTRKDAFPSSWINATNVDPEGEELTIREVTHEKVGKEKEKLPVIRFDERDDRFVCRITKWDSIVELTGEENSDNWVGKRIKLVRVRVECRGEMRDGVRIQAAKPRLSPKRRTATQSDGIT